MHHHSYKSFYYENQNNFYRSLNYDRFNFTELEISRS